MAQLVLNIRTYENLLVLKAVLLDCDKFTTAANVYCSIDSDNSSIIAEKKFRVAWHCSMIHVTNDMSVTNKQT